MRNNSDNLIVRLSFDLALDLVSFSEKISAGNSLKWLIKYLEVERP